MMKPIVFGIVLFILFVWFFTWMSHVSVNTSIQKQYYFVNFNTFLKEFNEYKDDPNLFYGWKNSSISLERNGKHVVYIRADVVEINEKCMIFYPIDFLKYKIWIKKNYSNNRTNGLSDED